MARSGMTAIINLVERLINDESNDHHTTEEVQDALDQHRWEARYLKLEAAPTRASGGTVTYVTFDAPDKWDYWETDGTLYDANYDALTPDTSDWTTGRWTFATEPTRPVTILGHSYDPYAAAADLLETRASQLSEQFQSFSALNGSFSYAVGKNRGVLDLVSKYRGKARARAHLISRVDLSGFNG